jgi:Glycosyltransferase sugar-binding region containing DXD motif
MTGGIRRQLRWLAILAIPLFIVRVHDQAVILSSLMASNNNYNNNNYNDCDDTCNKFRRQRQRWSLDELTRSSSENTTCSREDQIYMSNKLFPTVLPNPNATYRIPLIIHQTSKTRCIKHYLGALTAQWRNLPEFAYYFHDDEAVDRLFHSSTTFPQAAAIARSCLNSGAAKADLWRLLVLFEYGGVYADADSAPGRFNSHMLGMNDQAFVVIDQHKLFSQFFMVFEPNHPFLYMCIHATLDALSSLADTGKYNPVKVTGPGMIRSVFIQFMVQAGQPDPFANPDLGLVAGNYTGMLNWTLRAEGHWTRPDDIMIRDKYPGRKMTWYKEQGMEHFTSTMRKRTGVSCKEAMFRDYFINTSPTNNL